jgi:GT2 family glycosyltransferase
MIDLSIIIISYNTCDLTVKCVESIFKYTKGISFEVIVIDNASSDKSVATLARKFKSKITLIKNKDNLGFGGANNQGMSIAQGRYHCLLNSDTLLIGNIFEKALEWFDKKALIEVGSSVGMMGVKLLNPDRSEQESYGGFPTLSRVFSRVMLGHFLPIHLSDKLKRVDYIKGACMILKSDFFHKVGGFDSNVFMYVEEVEWCYRVQKSGYAIVYWPNASLIHFGGASSPSGNRAIFSHIFNGYRYFYKKHYSSWQLTSLELMLKSKARLMVVFGILFSKPNFVETYKSVLESMKRAV